MKTTLALVAALLSLTLVTGPADAQGKPELTVALSSFSTEVLDPVLGDIKKAVARFQEP